MKTTTVRLFVGGLNYQTTEEGVRNHFDGDTMEGVPVRVLDCVIIRDKTRNNSSKGFGFVTVESTAGLEELVKEFNKSTLDDCVLTVNEAKPQVKHEHKDDGNHERSGSHDRGRTQAQRARR